MRLRVTDRLHFCDLWEIIIHKNRYMHICRAKATLPERVTAAVEQGDARAVDKWLNKGGHVDACTDDDHESTLLMLAASCAHEVMVRML